MGPTQLIAAVSYMGDVTPTDCRFHSWRVAILSQYLASIIEPQVRRDVFLAGLLQDIGAVGANEHITHYTTLYQQKDDPYILVHSQRSAAIVELLPGMSDTAELIRRHHEWWDGSGYPGSLRGDDIPVGSQILCLADAADTNGCFNDPLRFGDKLRSLASLTGYAWSKGMWTAFIGSTKDSKFYRSLMTTSSLSKMISKLCSELGVPKAIDNDEGIERVLHVVAAIVDLKDAVTSGHSLRTARYAKVLAQHMRLSSEDAHLAYRAGLVHDCGRLGLPSSLVNRVGRLTEKELKLVRAHAGMTMRSLSCLPECQDMVELGQIAGHDHERYDGKGYPDGLSGDDIPPISRLLSAVDAFDAMSSSRSDRLLSPKAAVIRLQQNAGSQFDPDVVEAMVELAGQGGLGEELMAVA